MRCRWQERLRSSLSASTFCPRIIKPQLLPFFILSTAACTVSFLLCSSYSLMSQYLLQQCSRPYSAIAQQSSLMFRVHVSYLNKNTRRFSPYQSLPIIHIACRWLHTPDLPSAYYSSTILDTVRLTLRSCQ